MISRYVLTAGAPILGKLQCGGIGQAVDEREVPSEEDLWRSRIKHNQSVVKSLRDEKHDSWMCRDVMKDASLGRMSELVEATSELLESGLVQPRFTVEQAKPDGSMKLRSIDHFSFGPPGERKAASVNGHCWATEKLKHQTLDILCASMRKLKQEIGNAPGLWKADIDSAFRRIPVLPEHRWACGIAFKSRGKVQHCLLKCDLMKIVLWL